MQSLPTGTSLSRITPARTRHVTGLIIAILIVASRAEAQAIAHSFAELVTTLRVGQTVTVVGMNGDRIQGKVVSIDAGRLEIARPGGWRKPDVKLTFAEASVSRIEHDDSTWNGVLIGGAIGLLVGVLSADHLNGDEGSAVLVGLLPAGGGWAGQLLDERRRRVYYASSRTTPPAVTAPEAAAGGVIPDLESGTRVRVLSSRRSIAERGASESAAGAVLKTIGAVATRDAGELTVTPGSGQPIKIPMESIAAVDVSVGKKRNVLPGLLAGLAAGVIVGFAADVDKQDCGSESTNFCSRGAALAMGTGFMGALGTSIGAMMKTDRWVRRFGPSSSVSTARDEARRPRWWVQPDVRKHSMGVRVVLNLAAGPPR